VIEAVGPGGQFLDQRHTLTTSARCSGRPGLFDRQTRQTWTDAGSKPLSEVVQEKTIEILDTHKPPEIDGKIMENLLKIRERGEKELVKG
jgi:trimethylamine--corrinoid protein Co-methyltransferase